MTILSLKSQDIVHMFFTTLPVQDYKPRGLTLAGLASLKNTIRLYEVKVLKVTEKVVFLEDPHGMFKWRQIDCYVPELRDGTYVFPDGSPCVGPNSRERTLYNPLRQGTGTGTGTEASACACGQIYMGGDMGSTGAIIIPREDTIVFSKDLTEALRLYTEWLDMLEQTLYWLMQHVTSEP